MFNAKEIADLKQRIETLETELQTATTSLGAASTQATELQGKLDAAVKELNDLKAASGTAVADLAKANARVTELEGSVTAKDGEIASLKKDFEQRVAAEVTNRCAAAGIAPIARDPKVENPGDSNQPAAGLKGMDKARAALASKHTAKQ
jgi:chromosome segregation ATPase